MLVVAVVDGAGGGGSGNDNDACLVFLAVDLAGGLGADGTAGGRSRFFRCRPRFVTVVGSFSLRLRVVVDVGRGIFKNIDCGSCSGGIVRVVNVFVDFPVLRNGSSKEERD